MSHSVVLHVWRVRPAGVGPAVLRMAVDRWHLRGTPGLRFAKLLGTGDGRTFDVRDADPRTWALLTVWADRPSSLAFEAHPTPRGWRRLATHEWRADLVCLRTRGRWSGRTPFHPDPDLARTWDGPVASITRARIRPSSWRTFWASVPAVVADLDRTPSPGVSPGSQGVHARGHGRGGVVSGAPVVRLGIGEAPIGLQGTFTLWPDADALNRFAYRRAPHRQAIADTARLGWYAEELFARFAVVSQRGTLLGVDLPGRADAVRQTGPPHA